MYEGITTTLQYTLEFEHVTMYMIHHMSAFDGHPCRDTLHPPCPLQLHTRTHRNVQHNAEINICNLNAKTIHITFVTYYIQQPQPQQMKIEHFAQLRLIKYNMLTH